ncbi:TPA: hypothetical protein ACFP4Y_000846, partial [Neisseria bacilliformis]
PRLARLALAAPQKRQPLRAKPLFATQFARAIKKQQLGAIDEIDFIGNGARILRLYACPPRYCTLSV